MTEAMHKSEFPTVGLLSLAYNQLSRTIFAAVAARGYGDLSPRHGNVMEALSIQDGLRLRDLSDRSGITPQSMGQFVDELEALGYVERRADPDDRRSKRVHLTAKGRRNVRDALEIVRGIEGELEGVLGQRGLQDLRRALLRIVETPG